MKSWDSSVSVIVPAYNSEEYISVCLDSILAQGNVVCEIIVVDDGSIDKTAYICDEYARKYDTIKVIHQKNGGCSYARNVGLDAARGKYVAFVDSDDFIRPKMYCSLIEVLEEKDAEIAICDWDVISEKEKKEKDNSESSGIVCTSGLDALRWMGQPLGWKNVVVWNKLYRHELFNHIRFPEGKIHEDEFVFHELFMQCNRIVSIDESYYCYRETPNSIMRGEKRLSVAHTDKMEAIYLRFSKYEELGYRDLLRGAIECSKDTLSKINKYDVSSAYDKKRIDIMVKQFREMVKRAGTQAGLINHFIAVSPRIYYGVRGIIKGC